MATIEYKFSDGHIEEIEVTEEFAKQYKEIDKEYFRNEEKFDWRTRNKEMSMERLQKEFGMAIKKLREETGLSQEKFALSIGMDRTYYASVEAGKRNISLQNICKIAEGFGLSVSALFVVVEKQ